MKVKLLKNKQFSDRMRFAGSVVDVFDHEALKLIADGEAETVPDGTKARKVAYDTTACVPIQSNPASLEKREKQKSITLKS